MDTRGTLQCANCKQALLGLEGQDVGLAPLWIAESPEAEFLFQEGILGDWHISCFVGSGWSEEWRRIFRASIRKPALVDLEIEGKPWTFFKEGPRFTVIGPYCNLYQLKKYEMKKGEPNEEGYLVACSTLYSSNLKAVQFFGKQKSYPTAMAAAIDLVENDKTTNDFEAIKGAEFPLTDLLSYLEIDARLWDPAAVQSGRCCLRKSEPGGFLANLEYRICLPKELVQACVER
jgi:hypothetical protein